MIRKRKLGKKQKTNLAMLSMILMSILSLVVFLVVTHEPSEEEITDLPIQQLNMGEALLSYTLSDHPEFHVNESVIYVSLAGRILLFSWDEGDAIWEVSHSLIEARMIGNGEYVALWEAGRNEVWLFNAEGLSRVLTQPNPIIHLALHPTGKVAMVMEVAEGHYLRVLTSEGEAQFETPLQDANILPLGLTFAEDQLAIPLMDVGQLAIMTSVMLVDLATGSLRGQTVWIPDLVHQLVFWQDQLVMSYGQGVRSVNQESLLPLWEIEVVAHTFWPMAEVLAIETPDALSFINRAGEVVSSQSLAGVTYIRAEAEEVILGRGRHFYGMTETGEVLWQFVSVPEPLGILPLGGDRWLLKTPLGAFSLQWG